MFDKNLKLDLTQEDAAVIEAALQTQAKILGVQAAAGGSAARRRLDEVRRVLDRTSQMTNTGKKPARSWFGWWGSTPAAN